MYHGKNETKNRERERKRKRKLTILKELYRATTCESERNEKKKKKEIINGAFNAFARECTTRLTRTRAA